MTAVQVTAGTPSLHGADVEKILGGNFYRLYPVVVG
jgi:hypothetical protein